MGNRGKIVTLILISLFFILGLSAQGNQQEDIEVIIHAFQEAGAELESYWLHIGMPYGTYQNDELLLLTGNQLSDSFQLPKVTDLVKSGKQRIYVSKGTWGNGTEVELQLKRQNDEMEEMYFIFKLKGNHSLENFKAHYQKLTYKAQEFQISPKINSCIQGNINDKLSDIDQFVLIDDMLHKLDAREVEKLDTDLVKSISAFSPRIKHSIWTGNQKMNVQIAAHVNKLTQKTVLTMGTPIITIEY